MNDAIGGVGPRIACSLIEADMYHLAGLTGQPIYLSSVQGTEKAIFTSAAAAIMKYRPERREATSATQKAINAGFPHIACVISHDATCTLQKVK